jgi:sodium-dependent dicarboxylate transporter 2/3/5
VIGGVATLLGGARNPLAIALLSEYYGLQIGFFYWMVVAVPLTIVMVVIAYAVIVGFFGIDVEDVSKASLVIQKDLDQKGVITREEKKVSGVMALTLFAWIFFGHVLCLLICLGCYGLEDC